MDVDHLQYQRQHCVLGTLVSGEGVPLTHNDRRRHLYLIGKSGTGKSTLLFNMMISDLVTGRGFALLDPHGDPSKAAQESGAMYAGATSNKTAVRSKVMMKLKDPKEIFGPRLFGPLKQNYSGGFTPVELIFSPTHRIFVTRRDDDVTRKDHEKQQIVVAKVYELIRQGLTVVKNAQGDGQNAEDLRDALLRDGHDIPERNIKRLLSAAERDGQLIYHGNRRGSHGKAHYEVPANPRSAEPPTGDFMEPIEGGEDAKA